MANLVFRRDLVEHFARANGLSVPDGWSDDDLPFWVANKLGILGLEVGERIGLCGAAELLRTTVTSCSDNQCPENATTARQLTLEIVGLLRLAGVDPERWEEVRRG